MRVLVACEFSGIVRDAFRARGHDAVSCDLLPTEKGGPHIQGDARDLNLNEYDLVIAHPPCTHLASSGARWFKDKEKEQKEAIEFFTHFTHTHTRFCIENPVGIMSRHYRKPDQIIQPWQFGHGETKATCLWLQGLPKLMPTEVVAGRENRIHRMPQSADRGRLRSLTYSGIAKAMAEQWSES